MAKIRVAGFSGELPRMSPTLIPPENARIAQNARLYSGALDFFKGPTTIAPSPVASPETIYKLYPAEGSTSAPIWLAWTSDVNVARGQLADTTDGRVYYTGDGAPKKTNYLMASASGAASLAWLNMGVPAPATAPTATPASGTFQTYETRVYVYTYVSTFGAVIEEGAPSPPSALATVGSGSSCTISGFAAPPTSGYNITGIRIYRAVTGSSGTATYLQVAELDFTAGTAPPSSYVDNVASVSLGSALMTLGWNEPPADMIGLTNMPNGIMAAFAGNTLYFCEPYYHHAWPLGYAQSFPHNIIGIAVWGQSLVVVTDGTPYLVAGSNPSSMTVEKIALPQPGVSKRSVVGTEYGAIYASPEGLVQIGYIRQDLISTQFFHRQEWQTYEPSTINAMMYDNQYFGFFQSLSHGDGAMMFEPADKPGLAFLNQWYKAVTVDPVDKNLYYVDESNQQIMQFDSNDTTYTSYTWQSKRFYLAQDTVLSAVKIDYIQNSTLQNIYSANILNIQTQNLSAISTGLGKAPVGSKRLGGFVRSSTYNGVYYQLGGSLASTAIIQQPTFGQYQYLIFTLYDEFDNQLTQFAVSSTTPYRLPPIRSRAFTFQLDGTMSVNEVQLATSVKELLAP